MARGILGMLVNKGMSQALNRQPQGDPSVAKENRTALRSAADKAIEAGNLDVLSTLMDQMRSAGIDPGPYAAQAGQPTVEQQVQQLLNEVMQTGQISQPAQSTDAAVNMPEGNQIAPQVRSKMADIFTPEFATRSALKALSGIDIGEDAFFKKQFYNDYKALRDAGVTHSDAFVQLASKFGAIPDDASNLKEASTEERRVIFNRRFNKIMSDPVFQKTFKKAYPGADEKGQAALIFQEMAKNGEWIPDEAQALMERLQYKMTDTSEFLSDEQSAYAYKLTGKNPADLTPSEVALIVHGSNIEKRQNMIQDIEATENAQYAIKQGQAVDPKIAALFGMPTGTTAGELNRAGVIPIDEMEQATLTVIDTLERMKEKAMRLFKQDGINRFASGADKKLELFYQSNPDLTGWESSRHELGTLMAKVFGRNSGQLTEYEQKAHIDSIPSIWSSKMNAVRRLNDILARANAKLKILRTKARTPTESTPESKYKIGQIVPGKDDEGNRIEARYEGTDDKGNDLWYDVKNKRWIE